MRCCDKGDERGFQRVGERKNKKEMKSWLEEIKKGWEKKKKDLLRG